MRPLSWGGEAPVCQLDPRSEHNADSHSTATTDLPALELDAESADFGQNQQLGKTSIGLEIPNDTTIEIDIRKFFTAPFDVIIVGNRLLDCTPDVVLTVKPNGSKLTCVYHRPVITELQVTCTYVRQLSYDFIVHKYK